MAYINLIDVKTKIKKIMQEDPDFYIQADITAVAQTN
jgi:hypothetical protein